MIKFVCRFLGECRPALVRVGIVSVLMFMLAFGTISSPWMAVGFGLLPFVVVVLFVASLYLDKQLVRRFNAQWESKKGR